MSSNLAPFVQTHAYWVLAVGCLLDSEIVLTLAGVAAHAGYLDLRWVVAIAAASAITHDEISFWLGRRYGAKVLSKIPWVARRAEVMRRFAQRGHAWVAIGIRFTYGLKMAGAMLLGAYRVPPWRFAVFDAVGSILWAMLIAGLAGAWPGRSRPCSAASAPWSSQSSSVC